MIEKNRLNTICRAVFSRVNPLFCGNGAEKTVDKPIAACYNKSVKGLPADGCPSAKG